MKIVDDFLNITAIKIGTNILNISKVSLKPAMDDILLELKGSIDKMRLMVSFPADGNSWPELPVDYDKMRESLFIIMENAVRYNEEGGSVKIATSRQEDRFVISVENTGLGISGEESTRIGNALFYRGDYARKAYPIGMGIGLSVVKAIIRAHHGTFSITSEGKGKGAKASVSLPI